MTVVTWPMNSSEYIEFCIPTKCGSAMWTSLMIRYVTGKFPEHYPQPWVATDLRNNGFDYHNLLTHPPNKTILISRHPFSRFLSGYLDKAAGSDKRGTKFNFRGTWLPSPSSFREFVRLFAQHYPNIGNKVAKLHFLPYNSYFSCVNRSSVHFKLEDLSMWYPQFVRKYNMFNAVNDPRWEGGCWWKRENTTCKDSLISVKATNCRITRNKHNKNSCALLSTYLDETSKKVLYQIFKQDFLQFGYDRNDII